MRGIIIFENRQVTIWGLLVAEQENLLAFMTVLILSKFFKPC